MLEITTPAAWLLYIIIIVKEQLACSLLEIFSPAAVVFCIFHCFYVHFKGKKHLVYKKSMSTIK